MTALRRPAGQTAEFRFLVNPPAGELAGCSAVLNGRGTRYRVGAYRTTLSVKSVARGAAVYRTPRGGYLVTAQHFLILNEGQEYSLEFEGTSPTETVCPFLQPGLVEDAAASRRLTTSRRLDAPHESPSSIEFVERLYPKDGPIALALARLHAIAHAGARSSLSLEDELRRLAEALLDLRGEVRREIDALPALRASTREELYRRLHRGRDYILSSFAEPLSVAEVARVSCLSPSHFQRTFHRVFGMTPMRLVQRERLAAARRLLETTDRPVTDICLSVGFDSPGSFSWLFRRTFGRSPRAFRRRAGS